LRPNESVSMWSPEIIGRGGLGGADNDRDDEVGRGAVFVIVLAGIVVLVMISLQDRGDKVVAGERKEEKEDDVFCCISSSRRR